MPRPASNPVVEQRGEAVRPEWRTEAPLLSLQLQVGWCSGGPQQSLLSEWCTAQQLTLPWEFAQASFLSAASIPDKQHPACQSRGLQTMSSQSDAFIDGLGSIHTSTLLHWENRGPEVRTVLRSHDTPASGRTESESCPLGPWKLFPQAWDPQDNLGRRVASPFTL